MDALLKNKTALLLVCSFALLIVIGILTS